MCRLQHTNCDWARVSSPIELWNERRAAPATSSAQRAPFQPCPVAPFFLFAFSPPLAPLLAPSPPCNSARLLQASGKQASGKPDSQKRAGGLLTGHLIGRPADAVRQARPCVCLQCVQVASQGRSQRVATTSRPDSDCFPAGSESGGQTVGRNPPLWLSKRERERERNKRRRRYQ